MSSSFSRHRGLTLIELLVAIAILAVLIGLTLAAVQQAREAAARTDCLNRLRQQGLAVLNYESVHGRLPPGAVQGPFPLLGVPDGVSHSMWPFVLPYLDQVPVALRYRVNLPYDHPDNQPAATTRLVVLTCPNGEPDRIEEWDPPPRHGAVADYAPVEVNPFLADIGLIDPVGCFEGTLPVNGMVQLTDITDGTSTTLLLVEASGRPGVAWSSPLLPVGLRQVFGRSFHRHGTPVCMADGSVHFLHESIGLRVLARLATRSGGEPIDAGDF
jgi:prepilin-type N-terminal cleavage/methylation domain-containing protein